MRLDPIRAKVLSTKIIPNVNKDLAASLGLSPDKRSLGLITSDIDDVAYAAIDEATKMADVEVVYAKSLYAGSGNATTKLAGEFIGVLAGTNPEEVRSGIKAAVDFMKHDACFYSANDEDSIVFFAHTVTRSGTYLSKIANVREGDSLAYLIAPPIEALFALDAALKAADVRMTAFFGPPSETNFAGGLLTGSLSACRVASEAFKEAVLYVADNPVELTGNENFENISTELVVQSKPEHMTHLKSGVMIPKNHPRIKFRGKIDSTEAMLAEMIQELDNAGYGDLCRDLKKILSYLKRILRAEVKEEELPFIEFNNWSAEKIREYSHEPFKYFGIRHLNREIEESIVLAKLNLLRTCVRELEIAAVEAFYDSYRCRVEREDIILALNRLNSLVYVLMCRFAANDKKE